MAFLLPVDPYPKHKKGNKKVQIADTQALKNKSSSLTGVDLRWHTPEEYKLLSKDQRNELYKWQKSKEGKAITAKQKKAQGVKPKQSAKKKLQAKVAALQAELDEKNKEPTIEELTACITATEEKKSEAKASSTNAHVAAAICLKSILKRKRKESKE